MTGSNRCFWLAQVHGLEGDDFVDGHAGFSDRGDQEERREIEQGLQDDQEQGSSDRGVSRFRCRFPARYRELHIGETVYICRVLFDATVISRLRFTAQVHQPTESNQRHVGGVQVFHHSRGLFYHVTLIKKKKLITYVKKLSKCNTYKAVYMLCIKS